MLAGFDRGEYRLRVDEAEQAATLLQDAGLTVTVHPDHVRVGGVSDSTLVSRTLGEQGLWVRELTPLTPDLESVFLELTGGAPPVPQQAQPIDLGDLSASDDQEATA